MNAILSIALVCIFFVIGFLFGQAMFFDYHKVSVTMFDEVCHVSNLCLAMANNQTIELRKYDKSYDAVPILETLNCEGLK